MKPDFSPGIFRIAVIALFFLTFFVRGYSQTKEELSFSYKVDSVSIGSKLVYSITINVNHGNGPYAYYLCDKEPWFGGNILEQHSDIQSSTYTFSNLSTVYHRVILVKGLGDNECNRATISASKSR